MIINESRKLNEVSVHKLPGNARVYQNNGKYYFKRNDDADPVQISKEEFDKNIQRSQGQFIDTRKKYTETKEQTNKRILQAHTENRLKELDEEELEKLSDLLADKYEEAKRKRKESWDDYVERISNFISSLGGDAIRQLTGHSGKV